MEIEGWGGGWLGVGWGIEGKGRGDHWDRGRKRGREYGGEGSSVRRGQGGGVVRWERGGGSGVGEGGWGGTWSDDDVAQPVRQVEQTV